MTDPIADFLTRMRNAVHAGHDTCEVGASRLKERLARILQEEGFLADCSVEGEGVRRTLRVRLRRGPDGRPVVRGLQRASRPGRRLYRGAEEIPSVLGGLGVCIVSTSQGIMTGTEARRRRIGGEVVCNVW